MDCRASIDIYHYWNRLRGTDAAPCRKQIVPSQIAPVLPDLFILEEVAGGSPLFRLAGTRICDMFGLELHGRAFTALWNGDNVMNPGEVASTVIRTATPLLLNATGSSLVHDCDEALEIVLLPLCSTPDRCDRALGSISVIAARTAIRTSPLDFLTLDRVTEIGRQLHSAAGADLTSPAAASLQNDRLSAPLFGAD